MSISKIFGLLKDTFSQFNEDKAPRLGASLAYYTVFSLAPLLVIAIGIAGLVFGAEAARGQIMNSIGGMVGEQGAQGIQTMVEGASQQRTGGLIATQGAGSYGYAVPQNMRMNFTLSANVTGLAAGTYQVGLCGTGTNWNNNEYSYTTVLVYN